MNQLIDGVLPPVGDIEAIASSVRVYIHRYPDSTMPEIAAAVRVPLAHVSVALSGIKKKRVIDEAGVHWEVKA